MTRLQPRKRSSCPGRRHSSSTLFLTPFFMLWTNVVQLFLASTLLSTPQAFTASTTNLSNMSSEGVLNRVTPDKVTLEIKDPVDPTALEQARAILGELMDKQGLMVSGESLLKVAKRLGDVPQDATQFLVTKEECQKAYEGLTDLERTTLTNIHGRIKAFAEMQRKSVVDMEMDIPGGKAGHTVSPCRGE